MAATWLLVFVALLAVLVFIERRVARGTFLEKPYEHLGMVLLLACLLAVQFPAWWTCY